MNTSLLPSTLRKTFRSDRELKRATYRTAFGTRAPAAFCLRERVACVRVRTVPSAALRRTRSMQTGPAVAEGTLGLVHDGFIANPVFVDEIVHGYPSIRILITGSRRSRMRYAEAFKKLGYDLANPRQHWSCAAPHGVCL